MLRRWFYVALVFALLLVRIAPGQPLARPLDAQRETVGPNGSATLDVNPRPEIEPNINPDEPLALPPDAHPFASVPVENSAEPETQCAPQPEPESYFSNLKWLGLRHSSNSGRNVGMGIPLVGTSWLNRPYYFGGDLGTVWLTRPVADNLTTDVDMFGGVFGGCDWDYYWGTELAVNRATPEIVNQRAPDAERGDRLMEFTTSLMYYPWGDAQWRPYWRCGIGETEIDYPMDDGHRRNEELWTIPIGIGVKYPFRHWLAGRAEFADQLALGNHGVATQHDLTLTFGLEWRFGRTQGRIGPGIRAGISGSGEQRAGSLEYTSPSCYSVLSAPAPCSLPSCERRVK